MKTRNAFWKTRERKKQCTWSFQSTEGFDNLDLYSASIEYLWQHLEIVARCSNGLISVSHEDRSMQSRRLNCIRRRIFLVKQSLMRKRKSSKRRGGTSTASVRTQSAVSLSPFRSFVPTRSFCSLQTLHWERSSWEREREWEEFERAIVDWRTAKNERKLQVIVDGANITVAVSFVLSSWDTRTITDSVDSNGWCCKAFRWTYS